jgi:hypothetical protein
LNPRPSGYEPDELTSAPPRTYGEFNQLTNWVSLFRVWETDQLSQKGSNLRYRTPSTASSRWTTTESENSSSKGLGEFVLVMECKLTRHLEHFIVQPEGIEPSPLANACLLSLIDPIYFHNLLTRSEQYICSFLVPNLAKGPAVAALSIAPRRSDGYGKLQQGVFVWVCFIKCTHERHLKFGEESWS